MTCGRFGRYANRANLLSEHGRFLLSETEAVNILDGMVETIRAQWHSTMRRAGVSETDCEKISDAFIYDGFFYQA
jgi:serine/threonine-protein kinase HipA